MDKATKRALVGFVIGAAVGAAAGILFAPKKGSETRRDIKEKAEEFGKKVSAKVGEKMDEMKARVQEMAGNVKHKYNKVDES